MDYFFCFIWGEKNREREIARANFVRRHRRKKVSINKTKCGGEKHERGIWEKWESDNTNGKEEVYYINGQLAKSKTNVRTVIVFF